MGATREIAACEITAAVRDACIQACCHLPHATGEALRAARKSEKWPGACDVLDTILENVAITENSEVALPLCQDTGAACVFVEIGQDVRVKGDLKAAINAGVAAGYTEGYLRKSMVCDPLRRKNTQTNEPALITFDIVSGDRLKIQIAPKGAGSENMSQIKMLTPADGRDGVVDFVVDTVRQAGPNPCPPVVVGVGVGGNFDHVALLAKQALLRPVGSHNPDPYYAKLEEEILEQLNSLGIGPQGFGGATTALAVHIEQMATHIACLPVAVNINCHVARHAEVIL